MSVNGLVPNRLKVGVVVLLLFAFLSDVGWLRRTMTLSSLGGRADPVSDSERRLAPLRRALSGQAMVGYISDQQNAPPRLAYSEQFFRTRYALAPLIVVQGITPDIVIGDFVGNGNTALPDTSMLSIEKDLGGGLIIFQRHSR